MSIKSSQETLEIARQFFTDYIALLSPNSVNLSNTAGVILGKRDYFRNVSCYRC